MIEDANKNMFKYVEEQEKAKRLDERAAYWEIRANEINLSMPESLEYYEHLVDRLTEKHNDLKKHPEKRTHSYSLTYAKKDLNNAVKNLETAKKLWGEK